MSHLKKNPADLESRERKGGSLTKLWRNGPNWLMDPLEWPNQVKVYNAEKSDVEKKTVKDVSKAATKKDDKY